MMWSIGLLIAWLFITEVVYPQRVDFLKRKGELNKVILLLYDSSKTNVTYDVCLIDDKGDSVLGRIRYPTNKLEKYPAAFLMVGVETGKDVVNMIEGYDSVVVFSIDYPFKGDMDFSGLKSFPNALLLRKTGYETVWRIILCLDWLSSQPQIDTSDITMIAVSFGVFTAVPAAVIDKRVDKLVIVQAGGNLYTILKANADRLGFPLPNWLAGWLGSMILAPFEPNDFIGKFSPRPLLIVSSESDLLFPIESVQSLYDNAKEPKKWIKHKSSHVAPGERELILELTNIVGAKLYNK